MSNCPDSSSFPARWEDKMLVAVIQHQCEPSDVQFLTDPAWGFSSVSLGVGPDFIVSFLLHSLEDSAFVSWPEIAWSWKSCRRNDKERSQPHHTMMEKRWEQPVITYYFHPHANLCVKPKCIRHSLAIREYTPLATKIWSTLFGQ